MLHASSSVKIRLPEMCSTSTWPTRLGDHGSPLEDGSLPDSDQEVEAVDLERLLLRAMFPIAPNPLRVLQRASLSTPSRPWRDDVSPAPQNGHKNPDEPPMEAHWRLTVLPGGPTTSSTPSRLGLGPGLRWRLRDPSPSGCSELRHIRRLSTSGLLLGIQLLALSLDFAPVSLARTGGSPFADALCEVN